METVTLDGETYIKASVIARQFGYTADYIGQLCRAKKVDARLVGRTWFVNPRTLTEHKAGKYQKNADVYPTQNAVIAKKNYTSRIVTPLLATHKSAKLIPTTDPSGVATGSRIASLQYESDDFSLIPTVRRSEKPAMLPVSLADALEVHIKADSHEQVTLQADKLPEVSLAGTLTVADIEDQDSVDESAAAEIIPDPAINLRGHLLGELPARETSSIRDNAKNKTIVGIKKRTSPVSNTFAQRIHASPEKEALSDHVKSVPIMEETMPLTIKLLPVTALTSAFLVALTLFSLQSVTLVSLAGSQSFLQFDFTPVHTLTVGESLSAIASIF
ncbi:MAG: hypothetical protein AAB388_04580 [Patescibacteria group bacterium]